MSKDLLPCPLCGEQLFCRDTKFTDGGNTLHTAYCHCGFVFSADVPFDEFVELCNRRADNWTPCAEKPPEDGTAYFVTIEGDTRIRERAVTMMLFENGRWIAPDKDEIIAWQSLPKPWRGGENQNDNSLRAEGDVQGEKQ